MLSDSRCVIGHLYALSVATLDAGDHASMVENLFFFSFSTVSRRERGSGQQAVRVPVCLQVSVGCGWTSWQ